MIRLAFFPLALALAILILLFLATGDDAAGSRATVKATICEVFGPKCGPALRVAQCESQLKPWAWSGADAGVFQANLTHKWPGESIMEFRRRHANIRYHVRWAYRLSRGGTDWHHWRWSEHCWGRS